VVTLLEGRGALGTVGVEWSVSPETPAVRARSQHLEQVFLNLVMNAVKSLEGTPDPRIWIHAEAGPDRTPPRWTRRAEDPPGTDYTHRRRVPALVQGELLRGSAGMDAVIRVEDNGPGIPEDHVSRLFDPFFTTRDPGEGTGMGLAITSRIVQELGGKIRAENREEGGARFVLRFPGMVGEEERDASDADEAADERSRVEVDG
jgi:C4-dicarboxylate-specific signal transduction histidine kinase